MRTKYLLGLLIVLLFAGCSTIINGTRQKVNIDSEPRGAQVFVEEDEKGITPTTVKLIRRTIPFVRVEKSGYTEGEYTFYKQQGALNWLNLSGFSLIFIGLQNSFSPALMTISFFCPIIMIGIDALTGSSNRFLDKNKDFTLTKIPDPMQKDSCLPLSCQQVVSKISGGNRIGSFRNAKGEIYQRIYWLTTVIVDYQELVKVVNEELVFLDFNIITFRDDKNSKAIFLLNAEILEIDMLIRDNKAPVPLVKCKLKVKSELLNTKNNKVFVMVKEGFAEKQEPESSEIIKEALTNSLYNLFNEIEIREKVKIKSAN